MVYQNVDVFAFLVSLVNFGIMYLIFHQVVVVSMIDAVRVRRLRVQSRLDEIQQILDEAKATEATYKAQFERLPQEKAELQAAAEREITRTKERLTKQYDSDAEHIVNKAKAEGDKALRQAMADVQEQLSREAMAKAESMLTKVFDKDARQNMAENFVSQVGQSSAA